MQTKKAYNIFILFFSLMILTLFSCKNSNSSEGETKQDLIHTQTETAKDSQDQDVEQSDMSESIQSNEGIRLIIGDTYQSQSGKTATHVYFQVGSYPKVELPSEILGEIKKVTPEAKNEFRKSFTYEEVGKIVFSFQANTDTSYFAVEKDGVLRIYSETLPKEGEEYGETKRLARYDVSAEPKCTFLLDQHQYTTEMQQDFFQPITYSDTEIEAFLKKYFENISDINPYYIPFTCRYKDFTEGIGYYQEDLSLSQEQKDKMAKRWKVFPMNEWNFMYSSAFNCAEEDGKTILQIVQQKRTTYFYEATTKLTNEHSETCQHKIRLVQIDGHLYFDLVQQIS